jgi:hypothetical protein
VIEVEVEWKAEGSIDIAVERPPEGRRVGRKPRTAGDHESSSDPSRREITEGVGGHVAGDMLSELQ